MADTATQVRPVRFIHHVVHLGVVYESEKSMRDPRWYVYRIVLHLIEGNSHMVAKHGRVRSQVKQDIVDSAKRAPYEFALERRWPCEMHAAQCPGLAIEGDAGLDHGLLDPVRGKFVMTPDARKEASFIGIGLHAYERAPGMLHVETFDALTQTTVHGVPADARFDESLDRWRSAVSGGQRICAAHRERRWDHRGQALDITGVCGRLVRRKTDCLARRQRTPHLSTINEDVRPTTRCPRRGRTDRVVE